MMSILSSKRIEKLEQWTPTALYIAGGLLVLFSLNMMALLIGIDLSPLSYINFIAIADIIAIVVIFSFYPKLSVKSPRISLVGAIFLGIAGICFFVNQIVMLGNNLFQIPGFIIPTYFIWINHISFIVGFLLFGVAILRTNTYPNLLGLALLTVSALTTLVVILYILRGLGNAPIWTTMVIVSSQALIYFVMGYTLRNRSEITKAGIAVI